MGTGTENSILDRKPSIIESQYLQLIEVNYSRLNFPPDDQWIYRNQAYS